MENSKLKSEDTKPPSYHAAVSGESSRCPAYDNRVYTDEYETLTPPIGPPPAYIEFPRMVLPNSDGLLDITIKNACNDYVEESCCYGSRFVRDMIISSTCDSYSLHYKLESFGEMRQYIYKTERYNGEYVDGPENGLIPDPWNVEVPISKMFQDGKTNVVVPHSTLLISCWKCIGSGKMECGSCRGDGWRYCVSCSGTGHSEGMCPSCRGRGKINCRKCNASGRVCCNYCNGNGELKNYKELIVTWKNHTNEFVANNLKVPLDLIKKATGIQIFIEERPAVSPIVHSPDNSINQASLTLIQKHSLSFKNERIVMQRQTLRAVPNTKVTYTHRRKEGEFYVYGLEHKVYFEDYPQKCSCCICC